MPPQIPIHLNFDAMAEQIGKLVGAPIGGGAGAAGASGRGGVRGMAATGLMGPEGKRMETVGRGLGQIAKQLPGVGIFGDMAGAVKKGGVMGAGMAGIAGIMGFVKQILQSSKVFQGIAGSFFKIFGAMADVFLIPFLPLAMRGMNKLMQYLPMISKKGGEMADRLEEFLGAVKGNKIAAFFKQYVIVPIFNNLNKLFSAVSGGLVGKMDYAVNPETGLIEGTLQEGQAETAGERLMETGVENVKEELKEGGAFGQMHDQVTQDYIKRNPDSKLARDVASGNYRSRQLGGLVSGIHQGGAGGGGSIGSGFNSEMGNPLRNIRGKAMDVITGVGEDVRQLRKDTGTYVDSSARDFRNLGMDFSGGLRDSINSASSNVAVLEDTVQKVVTQANKDITYLENHVKSTQIVVSNAIQSFSITLAGEIEALEDEANAQRNSILDKAIYFNDIVTTWVGGGGEEEGLSSAELRELSGKLGKRTIIQEGVEQEERERQERERKAREAKELKEKLEREKREKEEEEQKQRDLQAAKDAEEARKAEEFRINTLKADPMFQSFAAMKNKLKSLQERLVQQNATKASLRANSDRVQSPAVMEEWVGPLGDSRSAVYLQKRRRQQYWDSVVRPAQDAYQRMSETTRQTRYDIENVEHWLATKHIPDVYSNVYGRVYENRENISAHQRSNLNFDAGGIVPGDIGEPQLIWAQGGEQISPIGMPKNNGGGNTSNRVLNINIQTKSSVKDILIDLANLKALDDASLFNSVW